MYFWISFLLALLLYTPFIGPPLNSVCHLDTGTVYCNNQIIVIYIASIVIDTNIIQLVHPFTNMAITGMIWQVFSSGLYYSFFGLSIQ